ncbi:cytoplasmic phosphatidylinositol transfer protein 1 isoform X2 [Panthera tigris]|uniref:cytoplasmic phosphatidylinositol transfer protein 1 isoform X2 n=1 Tax=Panthera tigris TaxID=9694 RepID=UPI001C6F6052|nr:cytoplasmic phosphatidylinositol transfer protein 1 isoform X2 [Panthera tigris]
MWAERSNFVVMSHGDIEAVSQHPLFPPGCAQHVHACTHIHAHVKSILSADHPGEAYGTESWHCPLRRPSLPFPLSWLLAWSPGLVSDQRLSARLHTPLPAPASQRKRDLRRHTDRRPTALPAWALWGTTQNNPPLFCYRPKPLFPIPGALMIVTQCVLFSHQICPKDHSILSPGSEQTSFLQKYKIGQLYMISKHSHEQSDRGEGVEVVQNEPFEDPHHGNGQFTEKRVYLNSKLPSWARAVVPKIFYVTEKAWNYYPYTITEYTCSFLPKFSIHIETKYEDNKGSNDRIFDNEAKDLEREVCFIDIACDEIPERYYKESEDPKHFKSEKTGRGQLREGWRDSHQPIMCSYKLVTVKFEVWGLQTRVEQFVHKVVRDILLIGHRQAFAWVDEWYDMTMDDVREYEKNMHEQTNIKVCNQHSSTVDDIESHAQTST